MKKLLLILATVFVCLVSEGQVSSDTMPAPKVDTIRIGNIVILKKKGAKDDNNEGSKSEVRIGRKRTNKPSNVSTNWGILDIGFANYDDVTNYATVPGTYFANRPGQPTLGANDFKLKAGKSINVNIWFFMQRLNLVKHKLNLKYGLGLELNNYRYRAAISHKESGTNPYPPFNINNSPYVLRDSISFSKNKLAADYLTIPFMLNFTSNPVYRNKGLSLSAGVSIGYLYGQRNKQKSGERGKEKNRGDYDMERFKPSYIAELGLGPVRLYASYSPQSIFKSALDIRPYTFGLRFSNW
jgi:Outer membrane protein beta-barrel domain